MNQKLKLRETIKTVLRKNKHLYEAYRHERGDHCRKR